MASNTDDRTIRSIKPGGSGRIVGLADGDRTYRQRLLSMGATPGTRFEVLRVAPLGDPYEIRLRGFTLSLRKHESDMLLVEPIGENTAEPQA